MINVIYTRNRDGATFALEPSTRGKFSKGRSRVFVSESKDSDLKGFSAADLDAVVKILTGMYDEQVVATFIDADAG